MLDIPCYMLNSGPRVGPGAGGTRDPARVDPEPGPGGTRAETRASGAQASGIRRDSSRRGNGAQRIAIHPKKGQ